MTREPHAATAFGWRYNPGKIAARDSEWFCTANSQHRIKVAKGDLIPSACDYAGEVHPVAVWPPAVGIPANEATR